MYRALLAIVIGLATAPASAELLMVIKPEKINGMMMDLYLDSDKVVYNFHKLSVEMGAISNFGDEGSPPKLSQRYTYTINCETGSHHVTNRIIFAGPMGTGHGQEIPDTPDSILKSYPTKGSAKGLLQAGLCKSLANKMVAACSLDPGCPK